MGSNQIMSHSLKFIWFKQRAMCSIFKPYKNQIKILNLIILIWMFLVQKFKTEYCLTPTKTLK